MWDTQAIAEAYHASVYNEVLRIPASVVTAKPAIATDPRLRDFLGLRFAHIPAAAIA